MSEGNAIVEPVLRRLRFGKTVKAVSRFDEDYAVGKLTDGQDFFNMRSAMESRPTAGKEMSRRGVRSPGAESRWWSRRSRSTFVDFSEVDACVNTLRSDGVYVFKQRIPEAMVTRMRESARSVPATARGLDTCAGPAAN